MHDLLQSVVVAVAYNGDEITDTQYHHVHGTTSMHAPPSQPPPVHHLHHNHHGTATSTDPPPPPGKHTTWEAYLSPTGYETLALVQLAKPVHMVISDDGSSRF